MLFARHKGMKIPKEDAFIFRRLKLPGERLVWVDAETWLVFFPFGGLCFQAPGARWQGMKCRRGDPPEAGRPSVGGVGDLRSGRWHGRETMPQRGWSGGWHGQETMPQHGRETMPQHEFRRPCHNGLQQKVYFVPYLGHSAESIRTYWGAFCSEHADSTALLAVIYPFVAGVAVVREGEEEKAHKIGLEMAGCLGGGEVD